MYYIHAGRDSVDNLKNSEPLLWTPEYRGTQTIVVDLVQSHNWRVVVVSMGQIVDVYERRDYNREGE